jgi:ribosomal protein S8
MNFSDFPTAKETRAKTENNISSTHQLALKEILCKIENASKDQKSSIYYYNLSEWLIDFLQKKGYTVNYEGDAQRDSCYTISW